MLKIKLQDLLEVEPLTENQNEFFETWPTYPLHLLHGVAGTGKTFIAMYKAIEEVLQNRHYKRLIILRSPVGARDIGHLPGDVEEKTAVFELPYEEICQCLFDNREAYQRLKEQGKIVFGITSFLRGLTFDNSIIIVDEIQNLNYHEAYSVMTRVGMNSKIIFSGDRRQADINNSGIGRFMSVLKSMQETNFIEFNIEDIVRSDLVKSFIIAEERHEF